MDSPQDRRCDRRGDLGTEPLARERAVINECQTILRKLNDAKHGFTTGILADISECAYRIWALEQSVVDEFMSQIGVF